MWDSSYVKRVLHLMIWNLLQARFEIFRWTLYNWHFPPICCLCCRYARRPEQWKRSQASKEAIYKEFQDAFGSTTRRQEQSESFQKPFKRRKRKNESSNGGTGLAVDVSNSISSLRSEFPGLEVSMDKLGLLGDKRGKKRERPEDVTTVKNFGKNKFLSNSIKATPFVRYSGKRKISSKWACWSGC